MSLFLVVYDGYVQDGRNAGYPEEKHVVCDSLADAGRYATQREFRVYECHVIDSTEAVTALRVRSEREALEKRQQIERDEKALLASLRAKYPDGSEAT